MLTSSQRWRYPWPIVVIGLFFVGVYGATLLPGLGVGDVAEFQRVAPTLGVAHSTGYPLYSLLGWLWSHVFPFGSLAWRMNAFSALWAIVTLLCLWWLLRAWHVDALAASLAVIALGLMLPFWLEATHAEMYAFAMFVVVLNLWLLHAWRSLGFGFMMLGLGLGLGLVHHRTIILWVPGVLAFVLLTRWPRWREILKAGMLTLLMLLFYLYIPWRAAAWQDGWQLFWEYMLGSSGQDWLQLNQLWVNWLQRPREIWWALVIMHWSLPLFGLSLFGWMMLWKTDRALAVLFSITYVLILAFCSVYVIPDLDGFLLPLHVIHAVCLAVGLTYGLAYLRTLLPRLWILGVVLLVCVPLWLFWRNLPLVQAQRTAEPEQLARALMAENLPPHPVVFGDAVRLESLRYLQAVEGQNPDWQWEFVAEQARIKAILEQNRPVFLLEPHATLPFRQKPLGAFWQVLNELPTVATPLDFVWNDQLLLSGMSLPTKPVARQEPLLVLLQWQALTPISQEYLRFVHLIGPDQQLWAQADQLPAGRSLTQWPLHTPLFDSLVLELPETAPTGEYTLYVGLYAYPSLEPLLLNSSSETDRVVLGTIIIR